MNKILNMAVLIGFPLLANAAGGPYLFDFAQDKTTGKAYQALIHKEKLPRWVAGGGTSTPANEVTINGEKFYALSGCRPHNCPAQSIAVLYAIDKGDIYGVYSEYDMKSDRQRLTWLNLTPSVTREMKNMLFQRLSGDIAD